MYVLLSRHALNAAEPSGRSALSSSAFTDIVNGAVKNFFSNREKKKDNTVTIFMEYDIFYKFFTKINNLSRGTP